MPKISPYFFDQIQLDGLRIPYYPCIVCKGKCKFCVWKNEPCILFFWFETRLLTSILLCFRFETRFMTSFARRYQRNVIYAQIQIHMQFICLYSYAMWVGSRTCYLPFCRWTLFYWDPAADSYLTLSSPNILSSTKFRLLVFKVLQCLWECNLSVKRLGSGRLILIQAVCTWNYSCEWWAKG